MCRGPHFLGRWRIFLLVPLMPLEPAVARADRSPSPIAAPPASRPTGQPPPSSRGLAQNPDARGAGPPASRAARCAGTYATDLIALSKDARALEEQTRYTHCVRSSAVYQCAYYAVDGTLQTRRITTVAHATAFVFRRDAKQSYLLTNQHVSEWPLVSTNTDPGGRVPVGCKRVTQTVTIVDNEEDSYSQDDRPLARVLADETLDVSVLRTPEKLPALPFSLGQSAALRAGDALRVRGFPLGAFQAMHGGKVVSARERDREGRWDHWDFVTDAQLSAGNSGSPVLAVSCATGRFELVGVFHAGYYRGQSLNVVVGVDELRPIMTTLKARARTEPLAPLVAAQRQEILRGLARDPPAHLVPYGGQTLGIRVLGGRMFYEVYSTRYPLHTWPRLIVEDLPGHGFGQIGRVFAGSEHGLVGRSFSALEPRHQLRVGQLVDDLRRQVRLILTFREMEIPSRRSRPAYERYQAMERQLARGEALRASRLRVLLDWAVQLAPGHNDRAVTLEALWRSVERDVRAAEAAKERRKKQPSPQRARPPAVVPAQPTPR
ncbi:MAG: trypsin-like peptidase domain-containing protein [Deltaproteobacteria bacterium]|nr:trypsin-like peptidase domain-containing protein [Deltaproteobacteria bacterium]